MPRAWRLHHLGHTRGMRRSLCTLELLSTSKITSFAPVRKAELRSLVGSLKEAAAAGETVDVSTNVQGLIESIMYKIILGRTMDERFTLKIIRKCLDLTRAFSLADFGPWLDRRLIF